MLTWRNHFLLFLFGLSTSLVFAQYAVKDIPPELRKGVGVVIRQYNTDIQVLSADRTEVKEQIVVTILDEDMESDATPLIPYDELLGDVAGIEGKVYDQYGREIAKLKRKQILQGDYPSTNLAGSSRYKLLNFDIKHFPVTIAYSYKRIMPSVFYESPWVPLTQEKTAVEKASLVIRSPKDIPLKYRWRGEGPEPTPQHTEDHWQYRWELEDLTFPKSEPMGLSPSELLPILFFTQGKMQMGAVEGSMESWESFGKMMFELQQNRQALPPELAQKVEEIAAKSADPHETIAQLYRFMQKNIRYESIQLGIGGYQTLSARYVYENGYGDCKALSNYMGSMLAHVGIPSYFTLVQAGDRVSPMMRDFAHSPFNHAILCVVPAAADTVWLECTSGSNPSGYLGSFTEDRHVLLCTPDGGKLTRTPKPKVTDNLSRKNLVVSLNEEGAAVVQGTMTMRGEMDPHILGEARKDQEEFLKELMGKTGSVFIDSLVVEEDHSHFIPGIQIHFKARATSWASVSGTRLFLKPNPIQSTLRQLPSTDKRSQPIVNYYAFMQTDSILYHLPEGFSIEAMDDATVEKSEIFGRFQSKTEVMDPQTLRYTRQFEVEKSRLPVSYYDKFRAFLSEVSKADRRQVVLSNKS